MGLGLGPLKLAGQTLDHRPTVPKAAPGAREDRSPGGLLGEEDRMKCPPLPCLQIWVQLSEKWLTRGHRLGVPNNTRYVALSREVTSTYPALHILTWNSGEVCVLRALESYPSKGGSATVTAEKWVRL